VTGREHDRKKDLEREVVSALISLLELHPSKWTSKAHSGYFELRCDSSQIVISRPDIGGCFDIRWYEVSGFWRTLFGQGEWLHLTLYDKDTSGLEGAFWKVKSALTGDDRENRMQSLIKATGVVDRSVPIREDGI